MRKIGYIVLASLLVVQCRPEEDYGPTSFPGKPGVPSVIKTEHESLLNRAHAITSGKDSTGRAAGKLYSLLQHHFAEEEDYVLPALGLLPLLAGDKLPQQSEDVIALCEKLRLQSDHMNAEHQLIGAFTEELMQVAAKEKHEEVIGFRNDLRKHAALEEQVLFPGALLVGEYLKLKTR